MNNYTSFEFSKKLFKNGFQFHGQPLIWGDTLNSEVYPKEVYPKEVYPQYDIYWDICIKYAKEFFVDGIIENENPVTEITSLLIEKRTNEIEEYLWSRCKYNKERLVPMTKLEMIAEILNLKINDTLIIKENGCYITNKYILVTESNEYFLKDTVNNKKLWNEWYSSFGEIQADLTKLVILNDIDYLKIQKNEDINDNENTNNEDNKKDFPF